MKIKMHLYWKLILPELLYESEIWKLPKSDKQAWGLSNTMTNLGSFPS